MLKKNWDKLILIISTACLIFLFEGSIYNFIFRENWIKYWIIIPILVYVLGCFLKRLIPISYRIPLLIECSNSIAVVALFFNNRIPQFSNWFTSNFEWFSFILVVVGIVGIIIFKLSNNRSDIYSPPNEKHSKKLFNLFYLNTSKAQEIAMLIDNRIVKNIESEQISSYSTQTNTAFSFGKKDSLISENAISTEESSKQRVYESFDVKHTKSVMLRKIYDSINMDKESPFNMGDLVLLENIQLHQLNVDDTVMILNVLQDSKLKNQKNDDIEINLNKMMDKMLDDFTIDYSFGYKDKAGEEHDYIIRLPYKSNNNFENGYQHNDLQLGKLSIIGIYRGEIDFSQKESISSKFLDLVSESYNQQKGKDKSIPGMKLSQGNTEGSETDFEFNHRKLEGKRHLIDVISIIQEINLEIEKS